MAVADNPEQERAALQMINPAPFNAEAPPEALAGDITPTELHYVRSNFAVPAHDGSLEIGGAVESPTTLTLDDLRSMPATERAVTLECAGNGRLATRPLPVGEPWGDYAVSTARWTGALLHEVLELARPAAEGVEARFEGADHGSYHLQPVLPETNRQDLTFVRSLPIAVATDPAAELLIAYEMNGEPLSPDHGAPFRLIVPHWYAVASVKWLKRIDVLTEPFTGEFQTGHYIYEWPDRAHEPVALMRPARASPTPLTVRRSASEPTRCAERPGPALDRSPRSRSVSPAKENGIRPKSIPRRARTSGRTGRSPGRRPISEGTACAPAQPTLLETSNQTFPPGTAWATETMRSRCCTSTLVDDKHVGVAAVA